MSPQISVVLVTNVDLVLPDRSTDGTWATAQVVDRLNLDGISLVLCSSRTRAEIEAFQQSLGLNCPFVAERGCAAFVPAGYFPCDVAGTRDVGGYHAFEFGRPFADIVQTLRRVAKRHNVELVTFEEMSVEEVARDCGLTLLRARLAKLREYGEFFRLIDARSSTHQRLFKALEGATLRCTAGDRFHHVTSSIPPARAVDCLYSLYKRAFGAARCVGASDAIAPFSRAPGDPGQTGQHGSLLSPAAWAAGLLDVVQKLPTKRLTTT
jgi:mannosyl-3-phosphoglycerate phosphatase